MSRSVQILVLFFLGIFVAPVLELDEKECKENYQKENHTYICASSEQGKALQVKENEVTPACCHTFFASYFENTVVAFNNLMQSDGALFKPRKIFLYHSVLLI